MPGVSSVLSHGVGRGISPEGSTVSVSRLGIAIFDSGFRVGQLTIDIDGSDFSPRERGTGLVTIVRTVSSFEGPTEHPRQPLMEDNSEDRGL